MADQETLISINDLSFSYDKEVVLDRISLEVRALDYLAIIGPNGGGKSTLIKLILGLLKPTSGSIRLFGMSPKKGRQKIGYLSQLQSVDFTYPISVMDIVLMSCLSKPFFGYYSRKDKLNAENILSQLGLFELRNRHLSELSGGQRQRVFFARALMKDPDLLVLDEPTCSVDPVTGENFFDLLKLLNKQKTIVVISHDISALSRSVKSVACLNKTLVHHGECLLSPELLNKTYCCDVDLISHGVPHRVFELHH